MRAQKVNETLGDILKGKSREEILADFPGRDDATFVRKYDDEATSLVGGIVVSYTTLVELFGEPDYDPEGYKSVFEWILEDDTGITIRIYDWKCTSNYDEGLPNPSEVKQIENFYWHIGANKGGGDFMYFSKGIKNTAAQDLIRYILKRTLK